MDIRIITEAIDKLLYKKDRIVIAIDGGCGTGKSTIADQINAIYGGNVYHTDDYFLRPEQRSEKRLSEIGGNIDYERFLFEIIDGIKSALPFSYTPFSCKTMSLGNPVSVIPRRVEIIEGSYSHRPDFAYLYDLRIFLTADLDIRKARIIKRAPERAERFFSEWMPKEDAYFEKFGIRELSDIIFETN